MNKGLLIQAALLFAVYKFAPFQPAKVMALGVAGVLIANKVPYLNGKDVDGKAVA